MEIEPYDLRKKCQTTQPFIMETVLQGFVVNIGGDCKVSGTQILQTTEQTTKKELKNMSII